MNSKVYWALHDCGVLIGRSLRHIRKNPDQLLSVTLSPIMFMLLFRYVFGGAIQTGETTYVNFLVAGILVQTAAFGSMTTSIAVANDLQKGIIDRFKSLPMVSWAVLMGHVTADLVRNIISSLVMVIVAFFIGFRPTATVSEWFLIVGILLMFTFAFSWLSAIMGLLARTVEAVQWLSFIIVFPVTFASAAFVPTQSMPWALRFFAENQPVTHVIEAMRALMVGTPIGSHAWLALVWCMGITAVSIPISGYLFRKKASR